MNQPTLVEIIKGMSPYECYSTEELKLLVDGFWSDEIDKTELFREGQTNKILGAFAIAVLASNHKTEGPSIDLRLVESRTGISIEDQLHNLDFDTPVSPVELPKIEKLYYEKFFVKVYTAGEIASASLPTIYRAISSGEIDSFKDGYFNYVDLVGLLNYFGKASYKNLHGYNRLYTNIKAYLEENYPHHHRVFEERLQSELADLCNSTSFVMEGSFSQGRAFKIAGAIINKRRLNELYIEGTKRIIQEKLWNAIKNSEAPLPAKIEAYKAWKKKQPIIEKLKGLIPELEGTFSTEQVAIIMEYPLEKQYHSSVSRLKERHFLEEENGHIKKSALLNDLLHHFEPEKALEYIERLIEVEKQPTVPKSQTKRTYREPVVTRKPKIRSSVLTRTKKSGVRYNAQLTDKEAVEIVFNQIKAVYNPSVACCLMKGLHVPISVYATAVGQGKTLSYDVFVNEIRKQYDTFLKDKKLLLFEELGEEYLFTMVRRSRRRPLFFEKVDMGNILSYMNDCGYDYCDEQELFDRINSLEVQECTLAVQTLGRGLFIPYLNSLGNLGLSIVKKLKGAGNDNHIKELHQYMSNEIGKLE